MPPSSSRAFLWPVLAVLVPCVVIGALGYEWLAVEREARSLRGTDAAERAVAVLRRDLERELRAAAEAAARTWRARPATDPPFAPPPAPPALFASAYLFDASGRLVAPDVEGAVERATEAHRRAMAEPGWARAFAAEQAFEANSQLPQALRAIDALLARSPEPALRAELWLARARVSARSDRPDDVDRSARQIADCCANERDQDGVSFALYAAWQRAGLYLDRKATTSLDELVRELGGLLDRGVLGSADDATEIELLARRLGDRASASELRHRASRAREAIQRRAAATQAATRWLAAVGAPAGPDHVIVGALRQDATTVMAAASRTTAGDLVVGLVEPNRLAQWIGAWAPAGAPFQLALQPAGASTDLAAVLATPLFLETPGLTLIAHQRASNPAADRSRERLFAALVASALVLTLAIGYLAVRDRSRELKTASLQSAFVAGVTHELKTPLASIRLLAETLRLGRARPEARDELLDTIVEEADRLSRLVDNVLSASRIESGTRAYKPEIVRLADAVRSTVQRFETIVTKDGFHIVERIDDSDLEVRADPDALGQAVLNLLGNAVKYSGMSREIEVGVAKRDGQAEVRVTDCGIGVSDAEQARIFDRFYRAPGAAAETAGAGLGLSLVRHFAEAHGGRVTVTSEPGRGSTFSVWLPLATRQEGEPDSGSTPARG